MNEIITSTAKQFLFTALNLEYSENPVNNFELLPW